MPTGPAPKGPRLWLEPERIRPDRRSTPASWTIRDDGGYKRRLDIGPADRALAEVALQNYLAEKHTVPAGQRDPAQRLSADVLATYAQDVAAGHARPAESASRIERLLKWWADPGFANAILAEWKIKTPPMTGRMSDVRTATCQAYVRWVGASRSASMDLEMFRAAMYHAVKEQLLDRAVPFWLPEAGEAREAWLTRSQVAHLVWSAWRSRRQGNGRSGEADSLAQRKHLARFMLCAHYTGTRSGAILAASFERKLGFGYIDLENGTWSRRPLGAKKTKKRQPAFRIPPPLLAHMRRWKKNGAKHPVEYHGQPVERVGRAMRALLAECREAAGYDAEIVPHSFRHTAITWAMQRGTDPWQASGFFGIDLQTLLDVYGHHHPDFMSDAVEKMSRPVKRVV
jgi:integrase